MKKQLIKRSILFLSLVIFLYGCSASPVTEEYKDEKKDVVYQTEKPTQNIATPTPSITEITVTTQPEFIPQGPPTPPPPPLKDKIVLEGTEVETRSSLSSPQFLYKVQVYAFKSRLNAESAVKRIKKRIPGQQVFIEFQGNLYKVRLGNFSKWEQAKELRDALYKLGYTDSFIVTELKQ